MSKIHRIRSLTYLLIDRQRYDELMQADSSPADVPRGMIGSVCLKSPERTTLTPPITELDLRMSLSMRSTASNELLWDIAHSSHIIREVCRRTGAFSDSLLIEQVGSSALCKPRGKEKLECAVQPPASKVAAIPEDTNANATRPVALTFTCSRFVRYFFLCHHMIFLDPVQEDHTAFSSADFSDFVVCKMLLVVECWNSSENFLSKNRSVIVCLPGENSSG